MAVQGGTRSESAADRQFLHLQAPVLFQTGYFKEMPYPERTDVLLPSAFPAGGQGLRDVGPVCAQFQSQVPFREIVVEEQFLLIYNPVSIYHQLP